MSRELKREYLSPPPPPSAIGEAMAKASERREKGLPVHNFASGNVGILPVNVRLFSALNVDVNEEIPEGLRLIAEGLRKGLAESFYPEPTGLSYSPIGGTKPVKMAVIRYFREAHGVPLSDGDVDRVIATAGGQQAMAASLRALKPGTDVLMRQWDYAAIPGIARDHNLNEVRVKVREDLSLDMADLEGKVKGDQVFYLSMPNNPTGFTSAQELRSVAEIMLGHDGGVIWDAPYLYTLLRLTDSGAEFDRSLLERTMDEFKGVVKEHFNSMCILSSLSKTCLIAGLRVGFATASKPWIANMASIISRENLSSPTLSFAAGKHVLGAFLKEPISHEWTCRVLAGRLTVLMEEVGEHLVLPRNGLFGALYVLVRTPEDGASFSKRLIDEKGIVTVPASAFCGGPISAVRLSLVATPWVEGEEMWRKSVRALKQSLM